MNERAARWKEVALPAAVLLVVALPRLWLAWHDHGVFWPDETYGGLEQAHRAAFGYGFIPWDFQDGMRSWLFPGLLAGVLRTATLFGARDALTLVRVATLAMVALSLLSIAGALRLAPRLLAPADEPERAAEVPAMLLAGAFAGALPIAVVLAHRALLDVAVAPAIVIAALLLREEPANAEGAAWRRAALAGALLGVAAALRPPIAPAFALLAGPALARRRAALTAAAGGAIAAFLLASGVVDWVTLGAPFHSLTAYVLWLRAHASEFPAEPLLFYPHRLWTSTGTVLLVIVAGVALAARRAPVEAATVVLYVAAHTVIAHKELRYLLPIVPLAAALAGAGLAAALAPRLGSRALVVLALAIGAEQGLRAASNRFVDYGVFTDRPWANARPWHFLEEKNLALVDAGRRADLCGLADVGGPSLALAGGYCYLHRDVPLFSLRDAAALAQPAIGESVNYAMTAPDVTIPGWTPVERGASRWLQRRDGPCVAHPELDNHLMPHPPGQRRSVTR